MKILHVISSLATGGAEHLMVDLLPRLRDMGNEVELLCIDGTRTQFYTELEQAGITIHSLGEGTRMYSPWHAVRIARLIRKGQYDIVHTHNTPAQLPTAAAKVLCSVVLCTTEHTTSNRRRDLRWYRPIDHWMYGKYKAIICISDQAEANLKQYLGEGKYPISTIYNGIDVAKFANAQPCSELEKAKGGRKAIVMVAGFRYQKDQDTLIRAMALLPNDEYELWLVGEGERRAELEKLTEEQQVTDRVRFLGLRSDVPSILKAADIVVMSSHFEGLSLSNLEGMSAGKPFIASDVDGLREIVAGNGLLFPHQDAEAFAHLVTQLSANEALKERTIKACQQKAAKYDISVMASKYNELYNTLI